jgi:hypothetical protein
MITILLYCIISILIIGIGHTLYFSLEEANEESIPTVVDLKQQTKKRDEILSHLKNEEREDDELEQYLKSKLKAK